jgi:hypothetical protein
VTIIPEKECPTRTIGPSCRASTRSAARLIREARARYDSIFPPADPVSEQQDA